MCFDGYFFLFIHYDKQPFLVFSRPTVGVCSGLFVVAQVTHRFILKKI